MTFPLPNLKRFPQHARAALQQLWGAGRIQSLCLSLTLYLALVSLPVSATADPIYLAPPGSPSEGPRTGSSSAPFVKLEKAVAAVGAGKGDHILLKNGYYGVTYWADIAPKRTITVAAQQHGAAHFDLLTLRRLKNLHFIGFSIWPRNPVSKMRPLVNSGKNSANLTFERFDIRGRADAARTYMGWSAEDWLSTWRSSGFRLNGRAMTIRNSVITGIAFGIETRGPNARVEYNHIRGFSGDGLRGLGANSVFRGNIVQDCFDVDKNHDDGFQSWAPKNKGPDTTLRGLTLVDNVIWEWTGRTDHPLHCRLQGIGLFDGFFRDVEIRNNLVMVNHFHGISIYGGIDSEITQNTVLHPSLRPNKGPWISVRPHKKKQPSKNVVVTNNVAMSYRDMPNMLRHNLKAQFPATLYTDPWAGDFTPKPGSPLQTLAFGVHLDPIVAQRLQKILRR